MSSDLYEEMRRIQKKKQKCRSISLNLYKRGIIKKPEVCEWCQNIDFKHPDFKLISLFNKYPIHYKKDKLEMHHEDYSKPDWVVWLCGSCHKRYHSGHISGPYDMLFPHLWKTEEKYNPLYFKEYRERYNKFKHIDAFKELCKGYIE